jgi:hypothetical protein
MRGIPNVEIEGREQFDDSGDRGRHCDEPEVGGHEQASEYDHAHDADRAVEKLHQTLQRPKIVMISFASETYPDKAMSEEEYCQFPGP